MALTPFEIISLIVGILVLLKIVVITINRKVWINKVTAPVYSNPGVSSLIFAVLAVIVFYYLLLELTIVQIFAVIAFASLLIAIGFLQYPKAIMAMGRTVVKKAGFSWVEWLLIVVWVILAVWAVFASLGLV